MMNKLALHIGKSNHMKNFYEVMESRRSIYSINADVGITDVRQEEIAAFAVKHTPSAYNMQSGRLVLLRGKHHKKLWDIVLDALRPLVKPVKFPQTEKKINEFADGYGTILFYDDNDITMRMREEYLHIKTNS